MPAPRYSLTHSLTHPLAHSLARSLTPSLTHSLKWTEDAATTIIVHCGPQLAHSLTRALTRSLTRLLQSREKLLEEAKRLADLQKRRELQAAGIDMAVRRRTRGIDHGKEVAFAHRPAPGFFDTAEEDRRLREAREGGAGAFRPVTVAELEGPRRRDVEARLQKIDIAKEKMRERRDAPGE